MGKKVSLKGVFDMHVHTNPDTRIRAYSDFDLCDAAVRVGARGIVIKSHHGSTAQRAWLTNEYNRKVHGDNDFTMYGSVTLNRQVGGINKDAVKDGFQFGAKVIWLPTQSARNHLLQNKKDTSECVEVVRNGKVVPELKEVFELIRENDGVLGTGHISPEECYPVIETARDMGVKKIVVTHPEWWLVGMDMENQIRLVKDYNVILEHCFAQNMGNGTYKSNMEMNLEAIRACGYHNVMVDTDGGQTENPHWEIAMEMYMQYLVDHNIPEEEINYMTQMIPSQLLGLDM